MQTELTDDIRQTPAGLEAESILRKCVHCGFCTATCPTYQLLGDELDGPRGRIYLIKQILEGQPTSNKTQLHLDRCLSCRNCETTCPSGVEYGRLLDIGREMVEENVERGLFDKLRRYLLRIFLPYRSRFEFLLSLGRSVRPLLPPSLKKTVPVKTSSGLWPNNDHSRTMLVLQGCVQPALAPNINAASARVLDALGIKLLVADDGCCGAISHHLSAAEEGLDFMRRNIDIWWPYIEQGVEAIIMTASGCGSLVKDYGHLLRHDSAYAEKAAKVSALTQDLSEVLIAEDLSPLKKSNDVKLAFHPPCSLQHGQKVIGVVESILKQLGFTLTPIPDSHLCCGSAGTYSILQPKISRQLKSNKINAIASGNPEFVVTANIGCITHLQSGTQLPVKHWIEVLDPSI